MKSQTMLRPNYHFVSSGMTLMETVIAIGVVAFTVPLILGGTGASLESRRNAEADTHAAWLAKDIQKQIAATWSSPSRPTYLPTSLHFSFPEFASASNPIVLLYDHSTKFIASGSSTDLVSGAKTRKAHFLVTAYSTPQSPANLNTSSTQLARLHLQIQYPARAPLPKRQRLPFSVVIPQQSF